jgi:hypothetical protein
MKKFHFLFILLLTTSFSFAQWTNITTQNTTVSDDAQFDETVPICAPSSNGSTFVSWFQGNSSGSYTAMLQLLDANGNPLWTSPLVISANPQSTALYLHDFTTDHDGNALFAFQDIRNGNTETVIYKIDTAGNFVWGNNGIQLHDANATFEAAPKIAIFDNNDVVVAWSASATGNKWVAWQIINTAGTTLFPIPQIIDSPTVNYSRGVPVVTLGGSFMLVFVQETGSFPGLTSLIYCQKFFQNGTADWTTPVSISSYTLGFVATPQAVADNMGGCYIGFNSSTPGAPSLNSAFLQHISAFAIVDLGLDGTELCALNANHKFLKDLYYNNNDNQVYAVLKVTDGSQNGAGVYAQAIDASGVLQFTFNALEVVPISTSNPCEAFTIDDAGNGLVMTYSEGGFNNQSIKAQKIDYQGNILFPSPITLSDANSGKSRITSNQMSGNQLVVSWEDSRLNAGIYAQNMHPDGSLGIITTLQPLQKNSFEIFTSEHFLYINNSNTEQIELFTADGKILNTYQLLPGQHQINMGAISSGVYFYKSKSGQFGKFLKTGN